MSAESSTAYGYYGNVAYDLSRFDNRKRVRETLEDDIKVAEVPEVKAVAKPKHFRITFSMIVSYVVLVSLFIIVVMSNMRVNELNSEKNKLENKLSKLKDEQSLMMVEYERMCNIQDIKIRAEELGLYPPTTDQVTYIDLSRHDRVEVVAKEGGNDAFSAIRSFFAAISGVFN